MRKLIIIRIVLDLTLAVAVLDARWIIALPLALIGAWFYDYYVEIIAAGIAYDALFGMAPGLRAWAYAGTIVSIIGWSAVSGLRRLVR